MRESSDESAQVTSQHKSRIVSTTQSLPLVQTWRDALADSGASAGGILPVLLLLALLLAALLLLALLLPALLLATLLLLALVSISGTRMVYATRSY